MWKNGSHIIDKLKKILFFLNIPYNVFYFIEKESIKLLFFF